MRLQTDPLRLIEAVTSGVAFLAAAWIIVSGGGVRGVTTGASMWLCGIGDLSLGLLALIVLWLIRVLLEPRGRPDPARRSAGWGLTRTGNNAATKAL